MTASRLMHIVFSGGVTGGHLFPGLAVAEQLVHACPEVRITFVGTGRPLEVEAVRRSGFRHVSVPCRPAPRRAADLPGFFAANLAGYRAARRLLRRTEVAVVVGLGGYASVPMARAAAAGGLPLVLLEQNAVAGRATRWLARSATLVCTAFESAARGLRTRGPVLLTGTPIRAGFQRRASGAAPRAGRAWPPSGSGFPDSGQPARPAPSWAGPVARVSPEGPAGPRPAPQLVILGGSGGARTLNRHLPPALARLRSQLPGWRIVHQSGHAEWEATRRRYASWGRTATVLPFVSDVPALLAQSHLAVCRAGGSTLAELAATGLPAVLLPYPHAADDHQRANAAWFTAAGAAVTVDERDGTGRLDDRLVEVIGRLLTDPQRLDAMSRAMAAAARPDAAAQVARRILRLARPEDPIDSVSAAPVSSGTC